MLQVGSPHLRAQTLASSRAFLLREYFYRGHEPLFIDRIRVCYRMRMKWKRGRVYRREEKVRLIALKRVRGDLLARVYFGQIYAALDLSKTRIS